MAEGNGKCPTSITFNAKRSLSFNGKELAVVPQSDLAGRYSSFRQSTSNGENIRNINEPSHDEEKKPSIKPVPAPRTTLLTRRPSSAGMTFKKQILTSEDLQPTGQPDRTYKVNIVVIKH